MADQNNAPERIWIKPCDPCENPYDYYVCDPRYLDGRETSYVKSIVACAGCGGGLKRQSGQFVCRDCGKAETVQEVLAPADRAAPEWQVPEQCPVCSGKSFAKIDGEQARWRCVECKTVTPPPAAPTGNTALVDVLASLAAAISLLERGGKKAAPSDKMFEQMLIDYRASLERGRTAALASREAPPAAPERQGYFGPMGIPHWSRALTPPPACQQEAVTVAEASHRLIVGFMLDCNVIGHVAAAENLVRGIKDHVAALRALKGEQK